MICPEGAHFQAEITDKEDIDSRDGKNKPAEIPRMELNSLRSPKTWKKSLTNFFRNQLRSTKSNDGDRPSGSNEKFDDKDVMSPEMKWQSLGKIFRRQSFVEHWNKTPNRQGESSSQSKRLAVRKVLSSYFGKNQKSMTAAESDK